MQAYMHACDHAHIYTEARVRAHTHTHTRVHARTHTRVCNRAKIAQLAFDPAVVVFFECVWMTVTDALRRFPRLSTRSRFVEL